MMTFLAIFGGVALILHGVHTLKKGVKRWQGRGFEASMDHWSRTRWRALSGGFILSLLAPSSTSLSVLSVQSVGNGQVSVARMFTVMLGADVGLTLLGQLLAFHIEDAAPFLVLIGVVLHQYAKTPRTKGIGQVFLSFGFLFLGIGIVKSASAGFDPQGDLAGMLAIAERHPFWLVMLTSLLSILLQSSTATIGLVIGLSGAHGPLSVEMVIPAVVGANIGVAFLLLGLGWSRVNARRLAIIVLFSKVFTGLLLVLLMPWLSHLMAAGSAAVPREVAHVHTGFNILKLMVMLPFIGLLTRLATALMPDSRSRDRLEFGPRYLGAAPIDSRTVAMGQSLREILRVSDIVRSMMNDWWHGFKSADAQLIRDVVSRDDQIDLLDRDIHRYLSEVTNGDPPQTTEQMRQLSYLCELETVGDIIEKSLSQLALKKIKTGITFSEESRRELDLFFQMVVENTVIADTTFHTRDARLAEKLVRHKRSLSRIANALRDQHLGRQHHACGESHQTAALFMDLVGELRRINNHISHVAYPILPILNKNAVSGALGNADTHVADASGAQIARQ